MNQKLEYDLLSNFLLGLPKSSMDANKSGNDQEASEQMGKESLESSTIWNFYNYKHDKFM